MILFYAGIDKRKGRTIEFPMKHRERFFGILPALAVILLFSPVSCASGDNGKAILWTDRPEFAFYAEYFNNSQDTYKVEVRHFESPSQKLSESGDYPDIIAASWIKNASTRALFRPLDKLFSGEGLDRFAFYPRLLSLGSIDGRQYLLPVSFNIPAILFTRDFSYSPSNPFIIDMEEIKERGRAFNVESGGVYSKMGLTISSDDEFLFISATLFGVGFREASPIAWDPQALEQTIAWLRRWIEEANTSIQAEDEFAYKYFFDPPDKLINSGRILYAYMNSADFFTLPEERQENLDFRWIAANEMIPLNEWSVYYGIHKKTKAGKAAEAFTLWFFTADTQRLLLEAQKNKRLDETLFGISGGFSAMRHVTEQIFPHFYPGLLGHMPPETFLSPANILPRNWMVVKERVILPYLRERIRHVNRDEVRPLERRITEWYRVNNK